MIFRGRKKVDESKVALEEAEENLKDIQTRNDEVKDVSSALREIRERNHFAEQMIVLMSGKGTAS